MRYKISISTTRTVNDKLIAKGWLKEIEKLSDFDNLTSGKDMQDALEEINELIKKYNDWDKKYEELWKNRLKS